MSVNYAYDALNIGVSEIRYRLPDPTTYKVARNVLIQTAAGEYFLIKARKNDFSTIRGVKVSSFVSYSPDKPISDYDDKLVVFDKRFLNVETLGALLRTKGTSQKLMLNP